MRNLEKGQHIFIAFQDGKAVLDSQLRPRIYTSLENAEKWTPTVNKGKIEYVEYASTLTPPNEWVSVEERLPEHLKDVIALYGNGRIDIDWVDSSGDFKFGSLFDGVTHWMPLPTPPDRRPPEV